MLLRGDHLWFDRWNEVMYIQPEWVEIISWNDYGKSPFSSLAWGGGVKSTSDHRAGESHYIGPIRQNALGALDTGKAPFNYVDNMPHDSWRTFLWFSIDMYLNNITFLTQEQIVYWYRPNPAAACGSGQTSGNTASQLQLEFQPASVMEDAVFYSALLTSDADVTVSIGGVAQAGKWLSKPDGGIGIYHGQVPFNGHTGSVSITLSRKGTTLATNTGRDITAACQGGLANWNAWVGEATSSQQTLQIPYLASDKVCVSGTGAYNFAGLCDFSCKYGYCPVGACLCTGIGTQKTKPNSTGVVGYPKAGLDASYSGLCSFNCDLGYCPPEACGTVSAPLTIPTVSDFLPPACTSGEGPGNWGGLCSYSCNFGFCPIGICTCTQKGTLVLPPPVLHDTKGFALNGVNDFGLCNFACPRGYCPPAACDQVANGGSGDPVYIDGGIWTNPTQIPGFGCAAPCVGVLPPYKLPGTTTLSCPPLTTTLTESWQLGSSHVTVSTISFKAITTTAIPVFNINITNGNVDKATYAVTPSIFCVQPITVGPPAGITTPALTYYITSTPPPGVIWPPLTSVKSSVSYTSTSPPFPTCTQAGGCGGHKCKSGCSGCGKDGCGCQGCCDGCGGRGGGGGGGGGKPPGGCVGAGCPPGTGPPGGGGGSGGGGGGGGDPNDPDDPECTSSTTVTDTTVLCTLSASPGSLTMDTTCTSTNYATSTGCELSATTTTSYHSVGCPTLPPYIPDRDDPNALLPAPGDSDWGGYLYATGTYTWAGDSPTTTTTKTTPVVSGPTAVPTGKARWDMYFWQHGSDPWTFSGYDNGMTLCLDKPAWTTPGGSRKVPDSLSGITVYGDSSCSFAKSSMTLTCSKWKAVTCKDVSQAGSGDAGTCATGADQYWSVLFCVW